MTITPFGVAVIDGDRLSQDVLRAGTLACADAWLQSFRSAIPLGGVVVDVGAALGDHTASYAKMVGPLGTVHAFEPCAPFRECLLHNAQALATSARVLVYADALGAEDQRGEMIVADPQDDNLGMLNLGMSRLGMTEDGPVRVVPLDAIAADWTRLDFIKIDVEGMEPSVLDGAIQTLERFHPALLVEVNAAALARNGYTPEDVYRRLRALGYTFTTCRPGDTLTSPEIDIICHYAQTVRPAAPVHRNPTRAAVHLLAVPNTRTTDAYPLDGFCTRTQLFAALLKRLGHTVYLYGVAENSAPCDEFISCLTAEEQTARIGGVAYQAVDFNAATPLFVGFNTRAAQAIRERKQPGDIIATIAGSAQMPVAEWHPELWFLEYSIGYKGVCAPFRVYQSQAWRHTVYGYTGVDGDRPFDDVIPPWFDAESFPVSTESEDYVAYCGRLVKVKGLDMACAAAREAGIKLVVMGHGDPNLITYGEFVGSVSMEERNRILSKARAVLMPTHYVEPFGNVSAEAQLCGTPVLASNWGAFTESVQPGISGYTCSTLGEYVQGIERATYLDRREIRARAVWLYGEEAAARAYQSYFARLEQARGAGVWSLAPTLITHDFQEQMHG